MPKGKATGSKSARPDLDRRIVDHAVEQAPEVAGRMLTQKLVLAVHVVSVRDHAVLSSEVAVPEQSQFLLQLPRRFDHPLQPPQPKSSPIMICATASPMSLLKNR